MSLLPFRQQPTIEQAREAVRTLIAYIGDDPSRPGLKDTPDRVLNAWRADWGTGYHERLPAELLRTFENGDGGTPYNQMVVVRNITFHSNCEHHMVPFFGQASIAYVPGGKGIVGLSKLTRVVEYFSRRLQVQERLTEQIADFLETHLSGDIGVLLTATHTCMASRGVRQPHSETLTTALRGDFYRDATTRSEFLRACHAER